MIILKQLYLLLNFLGPIRRQICAPINILTASSISIFENVCTLYKTTDSDKKNTIEHNQ